MNKLFIIILMVFTACCTNRSINQTVEKKDSAISNKEVTQLYRDTTAINKVQEDIDPIKDIRSLYKAVKVVNDSFCEKTFPIDIYNSSLVQIRDLFITGCEPEAKKTVGYYIYYYFRCGNNSMKLGYKKPEGNGIRGGFFVDSLSVRDNNFKLADGLRIGMSKEIFCKLINHHFINKDTILITSESNLFSQNFFIFRDDKLIHYRLILSD